MIRRRTTWPDRGVRAHEPNVCRKRATSAFERAGSAVIMLNTMTGAVEQSRTRWVAEALAVAAAYVVAATLRFVFPFTEQGASWVWLPSGVAQSDPDRPPSVRRSSRCRCDHGGPVG